MSVESSWKLMRASARVMRWVDIYTRGLPDEVADGRREELLADLHDQSAEGAETGTTAARVAREVTLRAFKGAPADLAWRRTQLRLASPTGPIRSGGLLAAAVVGAAVMSVLGILTVLRGLHVGTGRWTGWSTDPEFIPVLVGTAAAICGMLMQARPRTRFLGALWLVGAAQVLIVPGLDVLSTTSTVLAWASVEQPALRACAFTASVGVSLFYLAAAIAWMPSFRRTGIAS